MKFKVSYLNIFKATTLFGGVQVVQIIVSFLRIKATALFLGAAGVGIVGLFNNTLSIIITLFGLGLHTSAIRDISQAKAKEDKTEIEKIISVFRKLIWLLAGLGALFIIITSPWLSRATFGNNQYTYSFIFCAIAIVFILLNQRNNAILQGIQALRATASARLFTAVTTVIIAIPIYYFTRLEGIVPTIILSAIAGYFISQYYVSKVSIPAKSIQLKEVLTRGNQMIRLGFIMIISQLIGQLCLYFTNIYIEKTGGIEEVGYFQSAMNMTTQAVSLIFASMAADYFPRLSKVCNNRKAMNETVNKQGEILVLIAFPILLTFMFLSPIIIYILLSKEFYPIIDFIRLLSLGMLLKVTSFALGYISFAKGDKRTFFLLEGILGNFMQLGFNLLGYIYGGLEGLAYSFILEYFFYLVIISIVTRKKYHFHYSNSFLLIIVISTLIFSLSLLSTFYFSGINLYIIATITILSSIIYSSYHIKNKIKE